LLCERGIRTFETATRNTMDINAIPIVKRDSHLPILLDPSHGTGKKECVIPLARAGVAAGCDAIMVEVHPRPEEAKSDGAQALLPHEFKQMVEEIRMIAKAVGREA